MTTAPEPLPVLEASDLGRFEPTPYDLGITDDPAASWPAFPELNAATATTAAVLADPGASLADVQAAAEAEQAAYLEAELEPEAEI